MLSVHIDSISKLAQLFAYYRVYPSECYTEGTIVRILQKMYPDNHYCRDMDTFLKYQDYGRTQRGADLPWWGQDYFNGQHEKKVMIISNDSLSKDAGSIVFYTCLMQLISEKDYSGFIRSNGLTRFVSWKKAKDLIGKITGFDNVYITDAAKVYNKGSWDDGDFDIRLSRELLNHEIDICDPELVILLGTQPLKILGFDESYPLVVGRKVLNKNHLKFVVAPFPSNANTYNYAERKADTIRLVKGILRSICP